jgi:iron complex outermembrane receptor protein
MIRGTSTLAMMIGVLGSAPVLGQETTRQPNAEESSRRTADTVPQESADIVVTALRRSQSVVSAPLAISVVDGPGLTRTGVTNPQQLPDLLPNVQNGVAGFGIRGVSSGDFTEKGDPSTAFSLDGIYIARPWEQTLSFFDIDRVEVLRGPQGTLYGRNATAGAINVISARPADHFEASATGEYGNYDTRRLTAMINLPLSNSISLRLAGAHNAHDGYTATRDGSDRLDGRNDLAGRARLLIEVDTKTSILLSGDIGRIRDSGPAYIPLPRALDTRGTDSRYQNPGRDGYNHLTVGGTTAEVNSDLGFGTLTYLFGWRRSNNEYLQTFGDNGPHVIMDNDHEQDSHELRLASKGTGAFQWVGGLFYFHEKTNVAPTVVIPGGPTLLFDLHARASSKAAFGQITFGLTPSFRVVGGLRYTDDSKARVGDFAIVNGPSFPYDAAVHFKKWNWKAGIEYDIAPRVLAYASVSTGYKSGGFNDGNPQTQPALYYDPEDITAYEAGLKGRFLDGRLYASTAVFYYDYQGLQLSSIPPTGGIVTLNAAKATVKGFELEGNARVLRNGTVDFNFALLEAQYDRYLPLGPGGPNFAGRDLDRAPKSSFRIGYTQDFPLADGGRVSASISTKHSSSYAVTDFNVPFQYRQEAIWRTDLRLAYHAPGDRWYLQAFARNLENNNTLGTISFGSFTLNEPRLYGVRGGVTF